MCDDNCKRVKIDTIINMFNDASYFYLYGTQVFTCIFLIIFEVVVLIILSIKRHSQYYKEHWADVRCSPNIMPFAGIINKPSDMGVIAFTQENYDYCNQLAIDEEMIKQFKPIITLQENYNNNQSKSLATTAAMTKQTNTAAANTQSTVNNGVNKTLSVLSIFKYGYTIFMSVFSNIIGSFNGFFQFSITGVTWTTVFFIILSRAVMVIITIFFTISVIPTIPIWFLIFPLVYFILYVVILVIGYNLFDYVSIIPNALAKFEPFTLMNQPLKPKLSLCFDENTKLFTQNGIKKIKNIKVGEILNDGGMVTAIFKTISYPVMFNLNGIIVSGDHYVYHNKWIKVKNHPESFAIFYEKRFLYCLNTTTKKIKIKNHVFLDWDELDEKKIKLISKYLKKQNKRLEELHSVMDEGYNRHLMVKMNRGYKKISQIKPGEILNDGAKVLSLVKVKGDDLYGKSKQLVKYNVITDTGYFKKKPDYNFIIDKLFYMF